jgi:ribokinase
MGRIVSVGSINLDYTARVTGQWIAQQRAEYPWFPAAGATVGVETVPDVLGDAYDHLSLGGKGANQAVAAAAMGADVALVGAVGTDGTLPVGPLLRARGVDVGPLEAVEGPTGRAYVAVDEEGENYIIMRSGANALVTEAMVHDARERIRAADVVCLQNELPQAVTMAVLDGLEGTEERPTVIFDPSPIDGAAAVLAHPVVDITKPNAHEYDALSAAWADFTGVICQTRGPETVRIEGADTDRPTRHPPRLSAVNTTGAGDIFIGTLAAALAAGVDLDTAIDRGMVAGSLAVQLPTVHQSVPAPAAVDAVVHADR